VRLGMIANAAIPLAWGLTRLWGFPPLLGFSRLPVEPRGLATAAIGVALLALLLATGRRLEAERKGRRVR